MAVFDYSRLRTRLDEFATDRWPAARLAVVVDEHEQGTCFRTIGARLGVSKNAVISQGRRLGLPRREVGWTTARELRAREVRKARVRAARPTPPPAPPKPPAPSKLDLRHARRAEVKAALALDALHLGLISDLAPNGCKWPVGDPKSAGFGFCGRPRAAGPYCACHQAAAVDRSVTAQSHRGGIERLARVPRRTSSITGAWA